MFQRRRRRRKEEIYETEWILFKSKLFLSLKTLSSVCVVFGGNSWGCWFLCVRINFSITFNWFSRKLLEGVRCFAPILSIRQLSSMKGVNSIQSQLKQKTLISMKMNPNTEACVNSAKINSQCHLIAHTDKFRTFIHPQDVHTQKRNPVSERFHLSVARIAEQTASAQWENAFEFLIFRRLGCVQSVCGGERGKWE
jgi:hypothetical protein